MMLPGPSLRVVARCALALVLAGAASAPRPLPAAEAPKMVMVLPFRGDGVRKDVLDGLQAIFMEESRKVPGVTIPELTTRALVVASDCADDVTCLGKGLSRLGGTHFVLTVVTRKKGAGFELKQAIYAAPAGSLLRSSTSVLSGAGEDLEKGAFRAAVGLFVPERLAGGVQVDVNVAGAKIYVDNKLVGTSPMLDAYGGVPEGHRRLRVEKPGFVTEEKTVVVPFNDVVTVDFQLKHAPVDPSARRAGSSSGGPAAPAFPVGAVVVPPLGIVTGLVVLGLGGFVSALFAGLTYFQARVLEQRADKGQLIFPADMWRVWAWRLSLAGIVVSLVTTVVVAGVVAAATVAGTAAMVALHLAWSARSGGDTEETWTRQRAARARARERAPQAETPPPPKARKRPVPTPPEDDLAPSDDPPPPPPGRKRPGRPARSAEDDLPDGD